jgi:LEA14-like dessication related protein
MRSLTVLRRLLALSFAFALLLPLACAGGSSGGDSSGGDGFGLKLRRVEVTDGGFGELGLQIIALVTNTGSSDLVVTGGDVTVALKGRPERLADAVGSGDDGEESDDDDDAEAEDAEEAAEGEDSEAEDSEAGAVQQSQVDVATTVDLNTDGIITGEGATGSTSGGKVPAGAEAELPYSVTLPLPADTDALARLLSWEVVEVTASGTAQAGGVTESFEGTREIRLPLLPIIKLESQVGRVDGGREGEVFFHMSVYNPNGFDLEIDKIAYKVTIAGKEMLDRPGEPDAIPGGAERPYDESIKLNGETYGPEVSQMLRQPAVPFTFEGTLVVKGIEVPIKFGGEMEFPR